MFTNARTTFFEGLRAFNEKWLKELPARFSPTTKDSKSEVDALLEHHTRAFVLDKLIAALGWRSEADAGGPSNILTEAFLKSAQKNASTLFLDYLGYEAKQDAPLFVFEAKRFSSIAPKHLVVIGLSKTPQIHYATSREAICAAFNDPSWLKGDWKDHVEQLTRYYHAILKEYKQPPSVMAIGNGEWLVILREPKSIFERVGKPDSFLVFEPEDSVTKSPVGEVYKANFKEIYEALAFSEIAKTARGVSPENIPTVIKASTTVELMRGLRLGYCSIPKLKGSICPKIEVEPVVFVRLSAGTWVLVEIAADGIEMPHQVEGLLLHLEEVRVRSDQLVARIKRNLQCEPTEVSVVKHYGDSQSFPFRMGVTDEGIWKPGMQSFLLVTGDRSHFILEKPRILGCQKHFWNNCDQAIDGRHPPAGALSSPCCIGTKSFFREGTSHHCAAGATHGIKESKHEKRGFTFFGNRSSPDGEHFCEIFDFEQMLCCQTCVFFDVCSKSAVFKLPCI